MSAIILQNGKSAFTDANSRPLVGGKVYFYAVGTNTLKDTWQNTGQTTLNTNPVVLDARGEASIYGVGPYRQVLRDADNNLIWDQVIPDLVGSVTAAVNDIYLKNQVQVTNIAALRALDTTVYKNAATRGYYAESDGGDGSYVIDPLDTTSADNGGSVIVATDGGRWKLLHDGTVTMLQFGAKPDGTTDNTARFVAAMAATGVTVVRLPKGTLEYATGAFTIPVAKSLRGDGSSSSVIKAIGTTADLITMRDSAVLEGVYITGSASRTSGAFVICIGRGQKILDVDFNNYHIGIILRGLVIMISRLTLINAVTTTGSAIRGELGGDWFINNVLIDNGAIQPFAGFLMVSGGGVWMSSCDIIHCQNGVLLQPSGTDTITNFFVTDVACDNCSDSGWHIITLGSGAVRNLRFTNCWGATCGTGLLIQGQGAEVDGIFIVSFTSVNNSFNGISLNGDVRNYSQTGGVVSGNSQAASLTYYGIFVGANISNVLIQGVRVGPAMTFADIQKTQIYVTDGSGFNHNISGNSLDTVQTPMYFGPTDARNHVGQNSGAVDRFLANITTDASGYYTITHTAGFIANQVKAQVQNTASAFFCATDNYTRTSFRVRVFTASGTPLPNYATTIAWEALL